MIGHAIDAKEPVSLLFNNSTHVFIEVRFPGFPDQRAPVLNGKNKMNIKLSVSVWHDNSAMVHQTFFTSRILDSSMN
jgi:hypothetical protein